MTLMEVFEFSGPKTWDEIVANNLFVGGLCFVGERGALDLLNPAFEVVGNGEIGVGEGETFVALAFKFAFDAFGFSFCSGATSGDTGSA